MNPFQMIGAMKNPQAFIQQMMNNSQVMQNPLAKNAMEMYQKGDTNGLQTMLYRFTKTEIHKEYRLWLKTFQNNEVLQLTI